MKAHGISVEILLPGHRIERSLSSAVKDKMLLAPLTFDHDPDFLGGRTQPRDGCGNILLPGVLLYIG